MNSILDIAGKPLEPRAKRRFKAENIRDLCKIAVALLVITIGYIGFAPDNATNSSNVVAAAKK